MQAVCWLFRHTRDKAVYAAEDPRLPRLHEDPTWQEAKILLQPGFVEKFKFCAVTLFSLFPLSFQL